MSSVSQGNDLASYYRIVLSQNAPVDSRSHISVRTGFEYLFCSNRFLLKTDLCRSNSHLSIGRGGFFSARCAEGRHSLLILFARLPDSSIVKRAFQCCSALNSIEERFSSTLCKPQELNCIDITLSLRCISEQFGLYLLLKSVKVQYFPARSLIGYAYNDQNA